MHWEITSKNATKAQTFYATLFGWIIRADNPSYATVSTGEDRGFNGAIGQSDEASRVTIFSEVDNPQMYLDKAVILGGKIELPVTRMPARPTIAIFSDLDGNPIGLLQRESFS